MPDDIQDNKPPKNYDEMTPAEQEEADKLAYQEFQDRMAAEPDEPDESILDGTHPMYLDIEEQNIADFERKNARSAEAQATNAEDAPLSITDNDPSKAEQKDQLTEVPKTVPKPSILSTIISNVTGKPLDYYLGKSGANDYDAEPGVGPNTRPDLYGAPNHPDEGFIKDEKTGSTILTGARAERIQQAVLAHNQTPEGKAEREEWERHHDHNDTVTSHKESITVGLTEEQTKLLLTAEYPNNPPAQQKAIDSIHNGKEPVSVMDQTVALDFSRQANTYFAKLDRNDKPTLDLKLTQLMHDKHHAQPRQRQIERD